MENTLTKLLKDKYDQLSSEFELLKKDKTSLICKYESIFNTGREIIFKNFKLEEVNFLRNVIYNIDIYDASTLQLLDEEGIERKLTQN